MRKVECNISIGDSFVNMEFRIDRPQTIRISGDLSPNELAAINVIAETWKALSSGKDITRYFNPVVSEEHENELVRCKWERSGRLKIGEVTTKRFMHSDTVAEALSRSRVFTCNRRLIKLLPAKREVHHGQHESQQEKTRSEDASTGLQE